MLHKTNDNKHNAYCPLTYCSSKLSLSCNSRCLYLYRSSMFTSPTSTRASSIGMKSSDGSLLTRKASNWGRVPTYLWNANDPLSSASCSSRGFVNSRTRRTNFISRKISCLSSRSIPKSLWSHLRNSRSLLFSAWFNGDQQSWTTGTFTNWTNYVTVASQRPSSRQHRPLRMDLELIQRRLRIFHDRQRHPRRRLQVTVLQVFCLPLESKDWLNLFEKLIRLEFLSLLWLIRIAIQNSPINEWITQFPPMMIPSEVMPFFVHW